VEITTPADDRILITREFDAPVHLVYRVWTTPELVSRWWSGHRGTTTEVELDLRPGGRWRYVLKTDDGTEVGFHGEYREIVPEERIVYTEVFEMPGVDLDSVDGPLNTVTFTACVKSEPAAFSTVSTFFIHWRTCISKSPSTMRFVSGSIGT